MITQNCHIYGIAVDARTGCAHYRSKLDIIAIMFKCCRNYYACYECHAALADHPADIWQSFEFDNKAVLCGNCGGLLTIREYLTAKEHCSGCDANFNPGCKTHHHLYFAISDDV